MAGLLSPATAWLSPKAKLGQAHLSFSVLSHRASGVNLNVEQSSAVDPQTDAIAELAPGCTRAQQQHSRPISQTRCPLL